MKPSERKTVRDTIPQPLGKFVVFRHSSKLSRAHFSAIHDDYRSASSEAVRLLASSLAEMPDCDHSYYVVEIAARFDAGPSGLQSVER